jgi:FtsP/CotA-like multicopper oxidase with cupredoxin domain
MSSTKNNPAAARRGFLRAIGLSGAAAAAAVVPAGANAQAAAKENKAEREKARYKADSAHVQAFYRTNRY